MFECANSQLDAPAATRALETWTKRLGEEQTKAQEMQTLGELQSLQLPMPGTPSTATFESTVKALTEHSAKVKQQAKKVSEGVKKPLLKKSVTAAGRKEREGTGRAAAEAEKAEVGIAALNVGTIVTAQPIGQTA